MYALICSILLSLPITHGTHYHFPTGQPIPYYLWGQCYKILEKDVIDEGIDDRGVEWILLKKGAKLYTRQMFRDKMPVLHEVYQVRRPTWIQRLHCSDCS